MSCRTLYAKINLDAALIDWQDLQRHFARGRLIFVAPDIDLIEVGAAMAEDEAEKLKPLIDSAVIRPASELDASRWHETSAKLWAVVIAPWVLVQDQRPPTITGTARHDQID